MTAVNLWTAWKSGSSLFPLFWSLALAIQPSVKREVSSWCTHALVFVLKRKLVTAVIPLLFALIQVAYAATKRSLHQRGEGTSAYQKLVKKYWFFVNTRKLSVFRTHARVFVYFQFSTAKKVFEISKKTKKKSDKFGTKYPFIHPSIRKSRWLRRCSR